jgi:hypothetical protein
MGSTRRLVIRFVGKTGEKKARERRFTSVWNNSDCAELLGSTAAHCPGALNGARSPCCVLDHGRTIFRCNKTTLKLGDDFMSIGTILLIILVIILLGGFSGFGGGPFYGTGYYGGGGLGLVVVILLILILLGRI